MCCDEVKLNTMSVSADSHWAVMTGAKNGTTELKTLTGQLLPLQLKHGLYDYSSCFPAPPSQPMDVQTEKQEA